MANNKLAYGLAKKHGIDTDGMLPKDVWDILAKKGVDVSTETQKTKAAEMGADWKEEEGEREDFFRDEENKNSVLVRVLSLSKNETMDASAITKKVAIMGYNTGKPIRASYALSQKNGGAIEHWQKMRGEAMLKDEFGNLNRAEVHWYKNGNKDYIECKFKRWLK